MTLDDFLLLPYDQQQDCLWYEGAVLANRYEEDAIYLLYSLDGFFVELQYAAYGNRLQRVSAFHSTELLTPYLPLLPDDLLAEIR
jgi:hypothetical protein